MMINLPWASSSETKAEADRHGCGLLQANYRIACRHYKQQRVEARRMKEQVA